jgi:5-methylcytosine-specific restriction endonuclease McrA
VICKAKVIRRVDSTYKPTCSVACRRAVQCGQLLATSSPYEWRTDAQRRAREHGCHTIEDFDRLEIFERDAWTCYLCDRLCVEPDPFNPAAATVDHVIPMTRGGQHTRANVRTACLGCNSSKSDRISHAA